MTTSKKQRTARYAARLAKFGGVAKESSNHGGSLKSLNAAMIKGPSKKRAKEIAPVRESLVLQVD